MRRIGVTPHEAQNTACPGGPSIDGRTTRHEGYAKSTNTARASRRCLPGSRRNLIRRSNGGEVCASLSCAAPKRSLRCLVYT